MYGVFADDEYNLSKALPGFRPTKILDLGANVGMAAAYFCANYPDAQIGCVEPDPRNLKLLEQTVAANVIDATVIAAAVSSVAGTLRLRMGADPTCSALETSPMHVLNTSTEVAVTTVPEILAHMGWDRVDLVKIDIEGTEHELLGQNNEWLRRVDVIMLEIHPNTTPEAIQSFLHPYGFRLARHGSGGEPVYLATRGLHTRSRHC
jgi:FkbM family methyltransferase